jgi:hypothetical protein
MGLTRDDARALIRESFRALKNSANNRIDGLIADKTSLLSLRTTVTNDSINFTQDDIDDITSLLADLQSRIANEL